ncbi:Gfo/Idh/MocA family oxidoreductase [Sphingomonas sp. CFBP8993]|uniref:Gfo/Idh/MocA family protein n=1 Tax=Sphingomonas sp. CFBP8993 TaxID=3096526 RepID=UPI002A6B1FD4|nr:Gfo/Idh/MocA family oxidoreductase [Sphingomonas sp. CFBP8993]MDY0959001.1 Gfo/Idh/MocA family oxidoreductase [Sphingomonas sp. CFBP8993]
MRVLVIGLGDIAHKAYLPVLASRPDIALHLVTRDAQVRHDTARAWRVAGHHATLDAALATGAFDAAFVHAATEAHPALVQHLLEARIATFVDKPLADTLAEAERLMALAAAQDTLLRVGFNRRFAPCYATLRDETADLIVMEKHRHRQPDVARRVIFDDFIHVADTLLFMAPGPIRRRVIEPRVVDGLLTAITLMLAGDGFTAIGMMHRDSGLNEERLDMMGGGLRRSVLNMADQVHLAGSEVRTRRSDWTSVGWQRGFEAMCLDFLSAARDGVTTDAEDILATHALCEAMTEAAEAVGAMPPSS